MADTFYHFDGQPSGTAITSGTLSIAAGLSGSTNYNPTTIGVATGGTVTFDSAMAQSGPCGLKFVSSTGTGQAVLRVPFANPTTSFSIHGILTAPTGMTTGNVYVLSARISGSALIRLYVSKDGYCHLNWVAPYGTPVDYINDTGATGTTTADRLQLTAGTKYRFEIQGTINTSTGSLDVQVYPVTGSTTTPLNNVTHAGSHITGINTGSANIDSVDLGLAASTEAITLGWDEMILRDGTTSPYGLYSIPAIDVYPSTGTVTASGWTKTGAGTTAGVLGDSDNATYLTSPDNPTGSIVTGAMSAILPPAGDLVMTWRCSKAAASTGSIQGKLYTPDGSTLLATSDSPTVPDTEGDVTMTFSAASLAAAHGGSGITASEWASGLKFDLLATAAT